MVMEERWDLAIVGAGMAGLSTAIWARRLGLSAVVLEQRPEVGGQLGGLRQLVDYPGVLETTGDELAATLRRQAMAMGAQLQTQRQVLRLDAASLTLETSTGPLTTRSIVLATGLRPRRLGVPGEDRLVLRRPSHEPDWFRGKRVAVIGGGDRAVENSLLLTETASQIHLIHRSAALRARADFAQAVVAHPQVDLRLEAEVTAFVTQGDQVRVEGMQHGQPWALLVDGVCIYIGNQPNSELVQGRVACDSSGYVLVDQHMESSAPGLFAVGDVATQPAYQSLVWAAGQGMVAAKQIALRQQG